MTTEQAVAYTTVDEEGIPAGPITVRVYLAADDNLEETRQRLEQVLFYLGMIKPLPAARFTPLADRNWGIVP